MLLPVAVQTIKDLCQWTSVESSPKCQRKVRRARIAIRKAKVKMPRAKDRKEKEIRKEKKVITRAKVKATTFGGKPGHLAKDGRRNNVRQVASEPARSSSGGASVTTHTVGQQHANVSQQGSSAETKPVVRRIENSEPIIFDLRERDDELEDQGIRVVHFYIG